MAIFHPFSEVQNFANQVLSTRNGLEAGPMDLFAGLQRRPRRGPPRHRPHQRGRGRGRPAADHPVGAQRRLPSAEKDTKRIVP
ncbi:hypothetical protein QJS66_13160 [Kocuria rhizophila]|nr:hypothetical protein QJS66_13160 [Kocuria rhizophila]